MLRPDEVAYLARAKKQVEQLLGRLLRQDTNMENLLPEGVKEASSEEKVDYLTERLMFALTSTLHEPELAELEECRTWLRECILHLMTGCDREDRTFLSIRKILYLSQGVRRNLCLATGMNEKILTKSPDLLYERFDAAVLRIVGMEKTRKS